MADLFLHLPFARRLRFADGLHPLPGEAIGRRPSLVVLGAALAGLPENERRGMSWLRRLFSRGGEAARWQKLLAATPGSPHVDVIVQLLSSDDAALGPLARLALGIGVLSHEILEEKIGPLTSTLQESQRAAVERAQARLWLQSAIPGHLEAEWKPVLDLADADANRRALAHVDRALKRVHGSGPSEAALGRWLKGLAVEIGPLADGRGSAGALPPSLSMSDSDARSAHFESVEFVQKAQAAVSVIVGVANRLGEAFTKGNADTAVIREALANLVEMKNGEQEASRSRWKEWLQGIKEAALTRGRNPKPAFAEGEMVAEAHQRVPAATAVMRLSDLPPEVGSDGAPPIPIDASGPVQVKPPPPPTATQEVSLAQIEAEAAAMGAAREFQVPAHTQEVSIAQIESLVPVKDTPDHTQEVQTSQVVDSAKITQPISAADLAAANAEDARVANASVQPPPPPAATEPPQPAPPVAAESAPTEAHTAPTAATPPAATNGTNGAHDETADSTAASSSSTDKDEKPEPPKSAEGAAADPPRE